MWTELDAVVNSLSLKTTTRAVQARLENSRCGAGTFGHLGLGIAPCTSLTMAEDIDSRPPLLPHLLPFKKIVQENSRNVHIAQYG